MKTVDTAKLAGMICLLLCKGVFAGTNFYVSTTGNNSNSGTARTNAWNTIQWAVDHVGPGDTITVLAGTYAGALIQGAGLSNAPITLKADDGASVILNTKNPKGNSTHSSILWMEDWDSGTTPVAYWIIQGFEITKSPRYGIDIRGRSDQSNHHITLISNRVHNSTSTGIFTAFTDDALIAGNISYSNGEHGVYHSNSGDRPVIRGNTLYRNTACGVHMNGDLTMGGDGTISDGLVENNIIYLNGTSGSGVNMDGVIRTTVRNNLIYNSPNNSGIALFKTDGALPSQNNLITYNTVIMSRGGTSGGWAMNVANAGCVSNRILNNIFYSYDSLRGAIAFAAPSIPGVVCDYNALQSKFSTDGGNVSFISSLASWQALGYDTHSVIATPTQLFFSVTSSNYHLAASSPAIDIGTSVAGVIADIEGQSRVQGNAPDAGAYESVPPPVCSITVSSGAITPSGVVIVPKGGNTNFLVRSSNHYHISGLYTNQAPVTSYTYDNLLTNVVFDWNGITTNGTFGATYTENMWNNTPESWLAQFYPDATNYADAANSDTDHDGLTAWQEYRTGTDPTNSTSNLRISRLVPQATSNRVEWLSGPAGAATTFNVYRCTSLGGSWELVATTPKDSSGTNTWWDTNIPSGQPVYYRIATGN